MPRSSRPISVTLGSLQRGVDRRVKSGEYTSASEVLRAAVRALDREDVAHMNWLRQKLEDSLADPRPSIPAEQVFAELRSRQRARSSRRRRKVAA